MYCKESLKPDSSCLGAKIKIKYATSLVTNTIKSDWKANFLVNTEKTKLSEKPCTSPYTCVKFAQSVPYGNDDRVALLLVGQSKNETETDYYSCLAEIITTILLSI